MSTAWLYALITSGALVIGSLIGLRWRIPRPILAANLAFAGGGLIAALAYELFEQSFNQSGVWVAALGMAAGAIAFVSIDYFLVRKFRQKATGWSLLTAAVLDGIPENLALGVTIASGGGSVALLVAVAAANVPEGLVGAAKMKQTNRSHGLVIGTWVSVGVVLALSLLGGAALLDGVSKEVSSGILSFAAGAVLASLADTVIPEAYRDGGPLVALATVAGFLLAVVLNSLH